MTKYAAALGTEPSEIVQPQTVEAVQNVVKHAAEMNRAIIPWGGGTAQTFGYAPERADVVLNLSGMNRVLAHEPGDLTVTVEAGAALDTVQNTLAEKNQFLPLDAGHAQTATMGGIIASNAWGAGRTGYGTVRDWLIGLTVVDAQGRVVKGGGKVVKNVTGYDTPKLHVGALGTLGVLVEATFKVAPRPEAARPLLFILPPAVTGENGATLIVRLLRETTPTFAVLQNEANVRVLSLLFAGYETVVEHEAKRAVQIAHDFGVEAASALPPGVSHPLAPGDAPSDAALIAQFAGRPVQSWNHHEVLHYLFGASARLITHPATGHTTITLSGEANGQEAARKMIQWAKENQMPLAFLHAPLALRRREAGFALWSPLPPSLPIMQKLKQTLDPNNTLNPGRFVV